MDETKTSYEFPGFMYPEYLSEAARKRSTSERPRLEEDLKRARDTGRPAWVAEVPLPITVTEDYGDMRREVDRRFQSNEIREPIRIMYELIDRNLGPSYRFAEWYIKEGLTWAGEIPYSMVELEGEVPDAIATIHLGTRYLQYHQYERALELFRVAIDHRVESDTPDGMVLAFSYWSVGQLYLLLNDYKTAGQAFRLAAEAYSAESKNIEHLDVHSESMAEMVEYCEGMSQIDLAKVPAGVYRSASHGYSSQVEVEIEVRGGKILRVEVTSEAESNPLFAPKTVPQRIVDQQSINVEWEPGVKYTSRAIVGACFKALRAAITGTAPEQIKKSAVVHKVLEIRDLSDSTFVLRFERGELEFRPGHHIDVGVVGDHQRRKYSVYSGPEAPHIEVLIREIKDGRVSPRLRKLKPGDEIEIEGPSGLFRIPKGQVAQRPFLFVATGTGISPFHCFVQAFPDLDYTLIHGVRKHDERYEHDSFEPSRVVSCLSREQGKSGSENGETVIYGSRVTDYLKTQSIDPRSLCYLCGNRDMIVDVSKMLKEAGISAEQIFAEEYF